jgi:hypothetical protein
MIVVERYRGAKEARRARDIAKKNGWDYNIILNANGLYGCYGRTDCVVFRPQTDAEIIAGEKESLDYFLKIRDKEIQEKAREVFKSLKVCRFNHVTKGSSRKFIKKYGVDLHDIGYLLGLCCVNGYY